MSQKRSAVARIEDHSPTKQTVQTGGGPVVAECVDARHPILESRVRVRWTSEAGVVEDLWVPTLRGLALREQDRVLLQPVDNHEPIVVGVVDGFARRELPARRPGPTVELKPDETFTVVTERGEVLLDVIRSAEGPVVRLLSKDTQLELPGKLRISASEIELRAERGSIQIEANDDVVVIGEMVRLN